MSEQNVNTNPAPEANNNTSNGTPKITAPKKPSWFLSIKHPGEYAKLMSEYYEAQKLYLEAKGIADRISYKKAAGIGLTVAAIAAGTVKVISCFAKKDNETPELISNDTITSDDSVIE